jgi:hypothetical protein
MNIQKNARLRREEMALAVLEGRLTKAQAIHIEPKFGWSKVLNPKYEPVEFVTEIMKFPTKQAV